MARPRMIVVAGCPGSGKTRSFPVSAFGVDGFQDAEHLEFALSAFRNGVGQSPRKDYSWGPRA